MRYRAFHNSLNMKSTFNVLFHNLSSCDAYCTSIFNSLFHYLFFGEDSLCKIKTSYIPSTNQESTSIQRVMQSSKVNPFCLDWIWDPSYKPYITIITNLNDMTYSYQINMTMNYFIDLLYSYKYVWNVSIYDIFLRIACRTHASIA